MKHFFLTIIVAACITKLCAQTGVHISPAPIPNDPSAILNVQSQNQGVLLPRTTVSSVMNPTDGLIIFDTVMNHYMFYDQNQWTKLLKASAFSFYYADRDDDGFGDPFGAVYSMTGPVGYVQNSDDCNDFNALIFPGAAEVCDMLDNNCDNVVDDLPDNDMDGYYQCTDCDDNNPNINPSAEEICNNGMDDDCDGEIDESPDLDMDGYSLCDGDCNNLDPNVYPGAPEICSNNMDDDCNGTIDDEVDNDDDGFLSCSADCDDNNPLIYPGAPENCTNGIDDDCDGVIDNNTDEDMDGYTLCEGDCNDLNPFVYPGAPELCDGLDNDCNPATPDGTQGGGIGTSCDGTDSDLCYEGVTVCLGGLIVCNDFTGDNIEICGDDVDNNCNGLVDECANITWGNLQHPPTLTVMVGELTPLIYGQVYGMGVTDSPGQGNYVIAQVGYGPAGSDPSMGGWLWQDANYNTDVGNNDEYAQNLYAPTIPGTYHYAYRYSGDVGTTWIYGDLDGSTNGYSPANAGQLTVQ